MCGICGIIDFSNRIGTEKRERQVRAMNQAIHHRGPDGEGFWSEQNYTLAMRRLAIIDLPGGQQPIFNEDQSVGVFFNGEIYNFKEIKAQLINKGHQFKTHSDTEVLVHLYEEYDVQMPRHLKGMFAFCIFDRKKRRFLFARDRFGEKPFFYHFTDGIFSFSSEPASLLEHRHIPRVINKEALAYYLKMSLVPEPISLIKGVNSLEAGHTLLLEEENIRTFPYFKVEYEIDNNIKTEEDAIAYIKPHLEKAVKRQMVSDVPIGAFLSGGIDSSTIVALLQKQSSEKIKTFTVKFEQESYDESPIAREVAQKIGTEHHEINLPNEGFKEDIFWQIINQVGLPCSDTSCIPTYMITKEIRKYVTVALSGDGGDELFGGYPIFQWWEKIHWLKQYPAITRVFASKVLKTSNDLPLLKNVSFLRQAHKAFEFSLEESAQIPLRINEMFDEEHLDALYFNKYENAHYPRITSFWKEASDWNSLRKIMYYRLKYNLPNNILVKVDRMSMANSLEVRAPFLDVDLFEASAKVPSQFLIKAGKGKYLIRKMMEKELPTSIFNSPKKGFGIPLHKYYNRAYQQLASRLFTSSNPLSELLSIEYIRSIMQEGLRTQKNTASVSTFRTGQRLWALMLLFGWAERFGIQIEG